MEKFIANYLFTHNKCVVPSIGTLQIKHIPAVSTFGEQSISSPSSIIEFVEWKNDNNNHTEIPAPLHLLSSNIGLLKCGGFIDIPHVGNFKKDEENKISFTAYQILPQFLPAVTAERVIHPHDTHSMLVGETETNTAAMAEYYSDESPALKSKWWVWAIILFVIAAAAIGVYVSQHKGGLLIQ